MGRFMMANKPAKTPWNTGYIEKKTTTQKVFDCIFCEAEKSVDVTINKKGKVGSLKCKRCHMDFQCEIIFLDCEVDVYANWIDACEEAAKKEVSKMKEKEVEESKEKAKRMERKEKTLIDAPKPMVKKRKAETDAPKPVAKRSKLDHIQIEKKKPTDLTQTASTKPDSALQRHTSSAKDDARVEKDWELVIELDRKRRIAAAQAETQRKAALAKERRKKKDEERARIQAQRIREWKEVAAAVAAVAVARFGKNSHDSLFSGSVGKEVRLGRLANKEVIATVTVAAAVASKPRKNSYDSLPQNFSDEKAAKSQGEKKEVVAADPVVPEDIDNLYDSLFGDSSDQRPVTNTFDAPTPRGSLRSSPRHSEQQVTSTLETAEGIMEPNVAIVKTSETTEKVRKASHDSLFGSSSAEGKDRISGLRRDSFDLLFGSSK